MLLPARIPTVDIVKPVFSHRQSTIAHSRAARSIVRVWGPPFSSAATAPLLHQPVRTAPTRPGTSWTSSLSGSGGQPVWRARIPPGRPHLSLPSTRGTSGRQSSYERPRPAKISDEWVAWMRLGTDLLGGYGLLGSLVQLLNRLLVEAQILLAADEDDGQALAEVQNLGDPLQDG